MTLAYPVIFPIIHFRCFASGHLKRVLLLAQLFSGNLQTRLDLVEDALPTKRPHQPATPVGWWC